MKLIKIIVGGMTTEVEVLESGEGEVLVQISVFLLERGNPLPLDKMVRIVVIRDGRLQIV